LTGGEKATTYNSVNRGLNLQLLANALLLHRVAVGF